jgi:uncharacterized phiE125 gp8 family phage protein
MAEPITLTELKVHLDIQRDDQDAMLTGFIAAAREWVENATGLILAPRAVTQAFNGFGTLVLHAWPIAALPELEVKYTDAGGITQTVTDARLALGRRPATVLPAFGAAWPTHSGEEVIVSVAAGYVSPDDVPAALKAAMLLICGSLYMHREDAVVGVSYTPTRTVEMLCAPYRMVGLG